MSTEKGLTALKNNIFKEPSAIIQEVDDFIASMSGYNPNSIITALQHCKELFEYQGFDPKFTLAKLLAKASRSVDEQKRLLHDILMISCLVAMRGTNFKKIQDHATEQLYDLMNNWQTNYGITTSRPKSGYKKEHLTLSRIAAIYPIYSCLAAKVYGTCPVPEAEISDVPHAMRCTQFAGCIPKDSIITEPLKKLHLKYLVGLDKVIHSKDKKFTPEAEIGNFQDAAINNEFNGSEKRYKWLTELGLWNGTTLTVSMAAPVETAPADPDATSSGSMAKARSKGDGQ